MGIDIYFDGESCVRIRDKILFHCIVMAIFSVIAGGVGIASITVMNARQSLEGIAKNRIVSTRDIKKDQIEKRLNQIINNMKTYSSDKSIIKASSAFIQSFDQYHTEVKSIDKSTFKKDVIKQYFGEFTQEYRNKNGGIEVDFKPLLNLMDESSFAMQYNYILKNPFPLSQEKKLDTVEDGTLYSKVHLEYHPSIRYYMDTFGYADIIIADINTGNIVYSVAKDFDFTTSLIDGPHAKSGIGIAFKNAAGSPSNDKNFVFMTDFEAYLPIFDDPIMFVSSPIYDGEKKIGVLIFKISIHSINQTMMSYKQWEQFGLGETGETYLVGENYRMQSASRFFVENPDEYLKAMAKLNLPSDIINRMKAKDTSIGLQPVLTPGVKSALEGGTGVDIYDDYRGVPVLSAYAPIQVNGVKWAIISEIDEEEAFRLAKEKSYEILVLVSVIMGLVILCSYGLSVRLSRKISEPIEKFSDIINALALSHDLTKRIEIHSDDELEDMAHALNRLIDSFQETCQETLRSTEEVQSAAKQLMNFAEGLEGDEWKNFDLNEREGTSVDDIKDASNNLNELSNKLESLSRQFKVFEEESDRVKGW